MYLQIEDPSEAPLPPEEVRIRSVEIQPYPDGGRFKLMLKLTPFQAPPDIAIYLEDARGEVVSSLNVIGATDAVMSLTVHVRDPRAEPPFQLDIELSYEDHGRVDHKRMTVTPDGEG